MTLPMARELLRPGPQDDDANQRAIQELQQRLGGGQPPGQPSPGPAPRRVTRPRK